MATAKNISELPGWIFDADEVSAGVYSAFGRDRDGHYVQAKGFDPDVLIEECRQSAKDIMRQIAGREKTSSGD